MTDSPVSRPGSSLEVVERERLASIRRELMPFEALEERVDDETALRPTPILDHRRPALRSTVERLVSDGQGLDRFRPIFDFVRDRVSYEFAPLIRSQEDFRASHVLADGRGFCTQKALLLAALARAAGIPAVVGFQRLRDHKLLGPYEKFVPGGEIVLHGFNAVRLEGLWIRVDATLDGTLCHRRGYRTVEVDEVEDRILPATDLSGQPHFDVLEEYGFVPDLPRSVSDFVRWWLTEKHDKSEWHRFVQRHDLTM